MKKHLFEKSVLIDTEIEKLFNFHADTINLPKISPDNIKAELIHISDVPLKEGSTVTVRISKFGIGIKWKIKIEKYEFPNLISDLQTNGPFEYWHHYHIFEKVNDQVKMTDRIEFIPPFGFFGKLLMPIIRKQIEDMFEFRHSKTKEFLER